MDLDTRINIFGIASITIGFFVGRVYQYIMMHDAIEDMKHEIVQNREIIDEMMNGYWNGVTGKKEPF